MDVKPSETHTGIAVREHDQRHEEQGPVDRPPELRGDRWLLVELIHGGWLSLLEELASGEDRACRHRRSPRSRAIDCTRRTIIMEKPSGTAIEKPHLDDAKAIGHGAEFPGHQDRLHGPVDRQATPGPRSRGRRRDRQRDSPRRQIVK